MLSKPERISFGEDAYFAWMRPGSSIKCGSSLLFYMPACPCILVCRLVEGNGDKRHLPHFDSLEADANFLATAVPTLTVKMMVALA